MATLKEVWRQMLDEHKRSKRRKHLKEVEKWAKEKIQVREYNGTLFLCYDNIPLVEECRFKEDEFCNSVIRAREAAIDYEICRAADFRMDAI